jgi:VanZ like family
MNEAFHAWGGVIVASVLAIPVGLLVVTAVAHRRTRAGAPPRLAWATASAEVGMLLGTLPWIWMILTPRSGRSQLELVPGFGLAELLTGEPSTVIVQVGGNLLVFAAFGFLAPIRWPLHPLALAALAAAGSVTVEVLQYALQLGRVSSVDDVALNTLGATVAALAARPWWRSRLAGSPTTPAGRVRPAAGDDGAVAER